MNFDELILYYDKKRDSKKIAEILQNWKTNNETVSELLKTIDKLLGNVWFDDKYRFNEIFKIWNEFKTDAINNVNSMTMNERLYWFCLFERFESESNKQLIYRKLEAET